MLKLFLEKEDNALVTVYRNHKCKVLPQKKHSFTYHYGNMFTPFIIVKLWKFSLKSYPAALNFLVN